MNLITSRPADAETELVYATGDADHPYFTYRFSRVGIGIHISDRLLYGVVVGERTFWSETRNIGARYYVVLDEAEAVSPGAFTQDLIRLKDQYRARHLFTPNQPRQMIEGLRRQEGLTRYAVHEPALLRKQWPSFVETGLTASILDADPPKRTTIHRELDTYLTDLTRDVETGEPIPRADGSPIPRLLIPSELPTKTLDTALRQADDSICAALWYVVTGLEDSRPRRHGTRREHTLLREHAPNPTGY